MLLFERTIRTQKLLKIRVNILGKVRLPSIAIFRSQCLVYTSRSCGRDKETSCSTRGLSFTKSGKEFLLFSSNVFHLYLKSLTESTACYRFFVLKRGIEAISTADLVQIYNCREDCTANHGSYCY